MKSLNLLTKSLLILLGIFGLTTLVMASFSAWSINKNLSSGLQDEGRAIAESIAGASVETFLFKDPASAQALIDERRDNASGVAYILVVNNKGQVLAHTFVPQVDEKVRLLPSDRHQTISREVHLGGLGDCIDICAPILGGEVGYVHVGMDRAPIRKEIWQQSRQLVAIFTALFLVSSLAMFVLFRKISRPLKSLTD